MSILTHFVHSGFGWLPLKGSVLIASAKNRWNDFKFNTKQPKVIKVCLWKLFAGKLISLNWRSDISLWFFCKRRFLFKILKRDFSLPIEFINCIKVMKFITNRQTFIIWFYKLDMWKRFPCEHNLTLCDTIYKTFSGKLIMFWKSKENIQVYFKQKKNKNPQILGLCSTR